MNDRPARNVFGTTFKLFAGKRKSKEKKRGAQLCIFLGAGNLEISHRRQQCRRFQLSIKRYRSGNLVHSSTITQATSPNTMASKPTLTYFNVYARAEVPRILLEDAGVDYNFVPVTNWAEQKTQLIAAGTLRSRSVFHDLLH
jgi:hypothetical protein